MSRHTKLGNLSTQFFMIQIIAVFTASIRACLPALYASVCLWMFRIDHE
jgi:hypothetical protein